MYVAFRQGIINAPTNFLTYKDGGVALNTLDGDITITASHGIAEYLITEYRRSSVQNPVWISNFAVQQTIWLFWDINTRTGQVSYVTSTSDVQYLPQPPTNPAEGDHWFDLRENLMWAYENNAWVEKIRVLAGTITNGNILQPAPIRTSHAGNNTSYYSGVILFDSDRMPLRRNLKTFLTTEDTIYYDNANITATNIEAKTIWGQVIENVTPYSVVSIQQDSTFKLASTTDVCTSTIGVAMNWAGSGSNISVTLQGIITNPLWRWPVINQLLWVDQNGVLVNYDPYTVNTFFERKPPVARVLSPSSIIFMPSLVATQQTAVAQSAPLATDIKYGISKLSVPALNPQVPIVVGTNDPRLSDARTPTSHVHAASVITTTAHDALLASNVQSVLDYLYDSKLNLSGGTLTGPLTIELAPTESYHVVNKQYVDGMMTGLLFTDPVKVATIINVPSLSGLFVLDGYQLTEGDRVLIKNQTDATRNGIYNASTQNWVRAEDADTSSELRTGLYTFVERGLLNGQTGWVLSTPNPITLGVSNLIFSQFNGLGQITVGKGLTKIGNNIEVNTASSSRIISALSGIDLAYSGAAPGTYNRVDVDRYGRVINGSYIPYLQGNENITFTGDVSGYGSTAVSLTLPNVATQGTYDTVTIDSKGRVLSGVSSPTDVIPGTYNSITVNNTGKVTVGTHENYITSVTLQGDVVGTGAGTLTTSLSDTGVTPNTYNSVTVDSKGRVTAGTNVTHMNSTTLSGDVTGTGTGTLTTTLSNTGVTPNTYNSVTVDSKGRVTAGTVVAEDFAVLLFQIGAPAAHQHTAIVTKLQAIQLISGAASNIIVTTDSHVGHFHDVTIIYITAEARFVVTNISNNTIDNHSAKPVQSSIKGLSDVNITTGPLDGDVLRYDAASSKWVNVPGTILPYDIAFYVPTTPFAINDVVSGFLAPRSILITSSNPAHVARCRVAPGTSITVFSVKVAGNQIATVTFNVGSTTGVIAFTGNPTISTAAGDVVTLHTTGTIDPAIAGIGVTIVGTSSIV